MFLVLTVGGWGEEAPYSGAADPGAAAFDTACSDCHATPADRAEAIDGANVTDRAAALDALLSMHYAQDPEIRAAIIAYLVTK